MGARAEMKEKPTTKHPTYGIIPIHIEHSSRFMELSIGAELKNMAVGLMK